MKPKYYDRPQKATYLPVLQFRGETEHVVRVHPEHKTWVNVRLHWLQNESKTFPCSGVTDDGPNKCPLCPYPTRPVTYCPALAFAAARNQWYRAILTVNHSMLGMLDEDLDKVIFRLRRRGKKNSPVVWSIHTRNDGMLVWSPFDILPTLEATWGIQPGQDGKDKREDSTRAEPARVIERTLNFDDQGHFRGYSAHGPHSERF